jgi:two-component system, sensor histidine kinase and response regulator
MYFRSGDSRPSLSRHTSIYRRTLWHFLLLCVAVTLTLTAASFLLVRSLVMQRTMSQTLSIAAAAEDGVEQVAAQARFQAVVLASDPRVASAMAGRPADADAMLRELKAENGSALGLSVFAVDGRVLMAAGERIGSDSRAASVTPVLGEQSWDAFDVSVPLRVGGQLRGFFVVRYGTEGLFAKITDALPPLGHSAAFLIGFPRGDTLVLIRPGSESEPGYSLIIGGAGEGLALAEAVAGGKGAGESEDHRGQRVLAAWRSLPLIGGGLTVQVDRAEVIGEVQALAVTLLSLGILLFVFAALVALLLARSLTRSILSLANKVEHLGPGSWGYRADIGTGDEVQLLDVVVADMASRLKGVYEDMEGEIQARTKQLQEQFVFDRAILDSIHHGIIAVDAAGRVSAVNPAAERILGHSHEKMLDAAGAEIAPVRAAEGPLAVHPLAHCITSKAAYHPEPGKKLSIVAADGSLIPVMVLAVPLLHGDRLFGAVMVFQDVRDERLMDEMKSEFITLASHQLRTPLSILRWQMDILKDEKGLSETQQSSLQEMELAAGRMTDLLNALLNVSQLESGAIKPQVTDVDVCGIAQDVVAELKMIAERRKVSFVVRCPAEPLTIKTDASLLRIVLHNLLTNAVKYTREDTVIDVIVECGPASPEGATGASIAVTDRGLGIPAQEQRQLFTKFFRARNVRTVDTDGNGLGLYIIKMIVETLGGKIAFDSVEGTGSTFVVTLPGGTR